MKTALLFLCVLLMPGLVAGVSVTLTGTAYRENFDKVRGEVAGAGVHPWQDNATIPGWYAVIDGAPAKEYRATNAGVITSAPPLWLTRSRHTEASLGLFNGTHTGMFGVKLINGTGTVITALEIEYTGEQWARNKGGDSLLRFHYAVGSENLTAGDWRAEGGLNFPSLWRKNKTDTLVDGNAAPNRSVVTGALSGLSWLPGAALWLRWSGGGGRQPLSIDDLSVTVVGKK